ncbi:Rv2732c family membrane protein [Corynebacterium uterequi]|uniref:Transmembrane protein n=1 Tax=Corynebacterium uterequi TaxID=1072256 RepID=A0A0G3HJK3_9CORY|nr:hypothetical protein [Corynebacterium uterequi]AKK11297.1 hypothetical protein CUTER_06540 [Corynebacterium uterequi]
MESPADSRQLAAQERAAARTVSLAGINTALWVVAALWLAFMVLPYAGPVRGYEVAFVLPGARDAGMKITEYIFAILGTLGMGVFTLATLVTKRTVFALVAWMFSAVAAFSSLLAVWLRQTRPSSFDGINLGIGVWLLSAAALIAVCAYSMSALRRNPEQAALAQARSEADDLDEVGRAQRALLDARRRSEEQLPEYLKDDRRRRAAERHRPHD